MSNYEQREQDLQRKREELERLRALQQQQQQQPQHQYQQQQQRMPQQYQQQQYQQQQYQQQPQQYQQQQYQQQPQYQQHQQRQYPQYGGGPQAQQGEPMDEDSGEDEFEEHAMFDDVAGGDKAAQDAEENDRILSQMENEGRAAAVTVNSDALLRRCKLGDVELNALKLIPSATLSAMRDNNGRGICHYAAESRNLPLLQFLVQSKVDCVVDDDGLSPLHFAVLTGWAEGAAALGGDAESFEEVATRFAKLPAKFFAIKPAAKAAPRQGSSFWGTSSTPNVHGFEASELGESGSPVPHVSSPTPTSAAPTAWSRSVAIDEESFKASIHCLTSTPDGQQRPAATACAHPIGNLVVGGEARPMPLYVVSHVGAVRGALRGLLQGAANYFAGCNVAFTSGENLAPRLTPVCQFKWYQRVLRPGAPAMSPVWQEAHRFPFTTRADVIRRQFAASAEAGGAWRVAAEEDIARVATKASEAAAAAQVSFTVTEESLRHLTATNDRHCIVLGDFDAWCAVQLRVAPDGTRIAILFIVPPGEEVVGKAAAGVAQLFPDVVAVYVPSLGVTENTLLKNKYGEVFDAQQYLYVVQSQREAASEPVHSKSVVLPSLF